jgi:hypothetical protein
MMLRLATIALAVLRCSVPGGPDTGPFADCDRAPADVRLYLHVQQGAEILRGIRDRPIARWGARLLAQGQLEPAWLRLAADAGQDPADLLEESLGHGATLLVRGQGDAAEWALLTRADQRRTAPILEELNPRVLAPVQSASILHLPEHELAVAADGSQLVVGPLPCGRLWREMVGSLTAIPGSPLGATEPIAAARELGPGQAGIFLRHEPPMGGYSVAVAGLQEGRITLRHAARFESDPFPAPPVQRTWDMSPLLTLEGTTLVAFIEPISRGGGPLEAFIAAGLGQPLLSPEARANLGSRQITTCIDIDGRLENPPFDLLLPTFGRACEVRDAAAAWEQLDRTMLDLLRALSAMRGGERVTPLPDPASFVPGEPRHVPAGDLALWLLGPVPGADRVNVSWAVQSGPTGSWAIVATSSQHVRLVADALGGAPAGPDEGCWESCGTFDGRRLADHLRSWCEQGRLIAAPEELEILRRGLSTFADLAEGLERGRWRLTRPAAGRMMLEAELALSPPESAGRGVTSSMGRPSPTGSP